MTAETVTPNTLATSAIIAAGVSFLFHAANINRQEARRAKIKNLFLLVTIHFAAKLCGS
jgi:hypothetical protein